MTVVGRFATLLLLPVWALWPAVAAGQTVGGASHGRSGVGVVTTLAGTATVSRTTLPAPQALRFKDNVFERDRIATAEKSIVRVLLGGKALVTVRELSTLTITEETGRSTVDLNSGKIGMGVARQRMRPGEVIEIRTPNAIAAIRGTVLVVELIPAAGGSPSVTTKVHVLHGLVEVYDPKNPGAPPARVGTLESFSRTGDDPSSVVTLPPGATGQIIADLRSAPQFGEGPREFMRTVVAKEQLRAAAVAEFLSPDPRNGGSDGGGGQPAAARPRSSSAPMTAEAPVTPPVQGQSQGSQPSGGSGGGTDRAPTGQALFGYDNQSVNVGGNLYSLSGNTRDSRSQPILEAVNSSLARVGSLLSITGNGRLDSSGSAPLFYLDPSTLAANSLLTLGGNGRLSLVDSFLTDQGGTLTLSSDALQLSGNGRLTGSGGSALVHLVGTMLGATGHLLSVSGDSVMDLLKASAPLISMTAGSVVSTTQSALEMSGNASAQLGQSLAQLASVSALALNASQLVVQRGAALALSANSRLSVVGDLFKLSGGSTLTVRDGPLLSLSDHSRLTVTGALINFSSGSNTVSITNSLCPGTCVKIGGIPVFLSGGATPANVSITNPFKNGSLSVPVGTAVISVTGNASVTIQGQ